MKIGCQGLVAAVCPLLSTMVMVRGAAAVDVEDIVNSPGAYVHERVELEGIVEKLLKEGTTTTDFYMLRDDFGHTLRVRSAEGFPKVGTRYKVTGVISIHANSKEPYLSELKRESLEKPPPQPEAKPAPPPKPIAPITAPLAPEPPKEKGMQTGNIIGIVILVLALLALGLFLFYKKRESDLADAALASGDRDDRPVEEATEVIETSTMKIELSPATMKFMPGSFEILSEEERGRKIRIQGYPTREGAETTIGREPGEGDRRFAHVQLKQPTVSRRQAKLLSQGGKYYLMNMGETNPTQVNGRNLDVNESVELAPGDTIRLGEVELKFDL